MTAAHFEISIDGKPRTYRDTKAIADDAAAVLKKQYPNSDVVVRDLRACPASPSLQAPLPPPPNATPHHPLG